MENLNNLFAEIYDLYRKELFRYIYRMVRDEEQAQDVLQDVFVKILCVKDPGLLREYPRKWFYTVAKNECLRALAQKKRRETVIELDGNIEQYAQNSDEQGDLFDTINRLLDRMGGEYRDIFWLKHESRLKNNEIALILGISTKTVKRKLDQVIRELQGKIKLSDFQD